MDIVGGVHYGCVHMHVHGCVQMHLPRSFILHISHIILVQGGVCIDKTVYDCTTGFSVYTYDRYGIMCCCCSCVAGMSLFFVCIRVFCVYEVVYVHVGGCLMVDGCTPPRSVLLMAMMILLSALLTSF